MSGNRIIPALNATSDMPSVTPVETPVTVDSNAASDTPVVSPEAGVSSETTTPVETTAPVTTPTLPPSDRTIPGRFSELATQRREAELRAARLEILAQQQADRIEALLNLNTRQTIVEPPPIVTETVSDTIPRPLRDSFNDPETYETALVSWAGEQAAAKAVAETQRRQSEIEAENTRLKTQRDEETARADQDRRQREAWDNQVSTWTGRRAAIMDKYSDFAEVAENPELSIPVGSPMAHAILTREDGPEIAYYLGKHPEEAARISQMFIPNQTFPAGTPLAGMPMWDSVAQSFELGKIAAKLGVENPTPVTTPVAETVPTNALTAPVSTPVVTSPVLPLPPTPIGGSNANATYKSADEMTMEEYAAKRRPELMAERRPNRAIN